MSFQLWHIMAFAFLVSLTVSGFMRALNITDAPNARSSHTAPTPTAGGMGIVAGLAAALIALRLFYPEVAGFLPYNARRKAVIFCGDTGALFAGFIFAAAALLYGQADSRLVYAGPILIMPFLIDVLCTIILRASRGENILEAHRSHLYHIMLLRGASHVRVAFVYALWAVMMVLITLIGISTGLITLMTFLLLITIFGCWRWVRARRQMEQSFRQQRPR